MFEERKTPARKLVQNYENKEQSIQQYFLKSSNTFYQHGRENSNYKKEV